MAFSAFSLVLSVLSRNRGDPYDGAMPLGMEAARRGRLPDAGDTSSRPAARVQQTCVRHCSGLHWGI